MCSKSRQSIFIDIPGIIAAALNYLHRSNRVTIIFSTERMTKILKLFFVTDFFTAQILIAEFIDEISFYFYNKYSKSSILFCKL